jgi:protein-tyrosine kinase
MNEFPARRPHLVERAVEAMQGFDLLSPSPSPGPIAQAPPPKPPRPAPPPGGEAAPEAAAAPADSTPASISLDTLTRAGLATTPGGARSRISEEIGVVQHQIVRTMLAAEPGDSRSHLILIASARPGEGKTFNALNIAVSMAVSSAMPVVLVDADGKSHGSLGGLLGLAEAPGLRTLAADPTLHPRRMLVPTAVPGLLFLPYGAPVPGGPEVPPSAAMAAALQRLATAMPHHAVIVDTSPCLSTSDTSSLAPIAGQVVMVVQAERTQRNEVEAALDIVEACPTLQLLLNRVRITANDTFGAYGEYGASPAA